MAAEKVNLDRLPDKPEDALPDSTEPYGPCPRCGRASNFSPVGPPLPVTYTGAALMLPTGQQQREHSEQVIVMQCQGCRQNTVVIEESFTGGARQDKQRSRSGAIQWRGLHWRPTPGMRPTHADVPSAVAEAIAEGHRCLAVKAPRAAAVMYRGALGQIVTDRGTATAQSKRSLAEQLKQMKSDGDLDRSLAGWADHIRLLGNAGAHPNELVPVTMDEADELNRLIGELVKYLYITPAQVQRARNART